MRRSSGAAPVSVLVVGGGKLARRFQDAAHKVFETCGQRQGLDWNPCDAPERPPAPNDFSRYRGSGNDRCARPDCAKPSHLDYDRRRLAAGMVNGLCRDAACARFRSRGSGYRRQAVARLVRKIPQNSQPYWPRRSPSCRGAITASSFRENGHPASTRQSIPSPPNSANVKASAPLSSTATTSGTSPRS